jgi:phosphatidylglycerol lysyltransferase
MIGRLTVIGLACGLVGVPLYGVWKARRGEAAYPACGRFIEAGGVTLHYVRVGEAGACPLVLLHGSDGFLQDFPLPLLERLARDYDVIVPDRPGHGYSDAPADRPLTPHVQAELLHAALTKLGIVRPLLVAHSWSATLALDYALTYPDDVAGLTLLAGWAYPDTCPPSRLLYLPLLPLIGDPLTRLLLTPLRGALIDYHLRRAFAPGRVPRAYARAARALWQRRPFQTRAFAQENLTAHATLGELSQRYGEIEVPTVIVTGTADRVVDPVRNSERLQAAIPNARLIRIPHFGHELQHAAPDAVVEVIGLCRQLAGEQEDLAQEEYASEQKARGKAAQLQAQEIDPEYARARELVYCYGWNATSYQILNPGIRYRFSPDGEAVVGYVRRKGVRIVAGAPVCAMDRLPEVIAEFEEDAARLGDRVCYFAAADRLYSVLCASPGHSTLAIGAQPVWYPGNWQAILKHNASLRAQLNRARNKGVSIAEWPPEQAGADAGLRRCLAEWLERHTLPALEFLTRPVELGRLGDRRLFVADLNGATVGFLIATPIPDRNGWLIEQIVRGHQAVNGTPELLVDGAMRALATAGADYVTLGLAPLSRRVPEEEEMQSWLRLLLAWMRAHGTRFYNFEGLDAFKAKFKPDYWEPIYAISNEPRVSPRTLYAIAAAFSGGSPVHAIARALVAAVRQEMTWLHARRRARRIPGTKR